MKINLLYDSDKILSGHTNVDSFAINDKNKVCCDLEQLYFCSRGEATEILVDNVLSYYSAKQVKQMLAHYISLLAYGGSLSVTDVNAYEVSRRFMLNKINSDEFNKLLFGEKYSRKSLLNITDVSNLMTSMGLKIKFKKINDTEFTVVGVR